MARMPGVGVSARGRFFRSGRSVFYIVCHMLVHVCPIGCSCSMSMVMVGGGVGGVFPIV